MKSEDDPLTEEELTRIRAAILTGASKEDQSLRLIVRRMLENDGVGASPAEIIFLCNQILLLKKWGVP
jgi:hypothetical protein